METVLVDGLGSRDSLSEVLTLAVSGLFTGLNNLWKSMVHWLKFLYKSRCPRNLIMNQSEKKNNLHLLFFISIFPPHPISFECFCPGEAEYPFKRVDIYFMHSEKLYFKYLDLGGALVYYGVSTVLVSISITFGLQLKDAN